MMPEREELVVRIVSLLGSITEQLEFENLLFIALVSGPEQPSKQLTLRERKAELLRWAREEPGDERETRLYNALLRVTGSKAPHVPLRSGATADDAPSVAAASVPARIKSLQDLAAMIATRTASDTTLVSGFLSGGAVDPTQRYHLGHYYFVRAIEALLSATVRVNLLICDPLSQRVDETYRASVSKQTKIWENCFEGGVRAREIHAAVEKCEVTGAYHDVAMWIGDRMERADGALGRFDGALWNWKKRATKPSDIILDAIRQTLKDDDHEEVVDASTDEEILSIATLLSKPPRWLKLTSDWGAKMFRFITDGSVKRVLHTKHIILFEGERNRYIWDGLAYCARRFGLSATFPEREYIPSVPGIGTLDAMQSKEETKKIPLDPDWIDSHQDVPRESLRPIVERFDFGADVDEYRAIKALTTDGARRLSQKYPGNTTL